MIIIGTNGAARRMPTVAQALFCLLTTLLLAYAFSISPKHTLLAIVMVLQGGFVVTALWRAALAIASLSPTPASPRPPRWPRYTILAALHDEAAVVPQLVQRLSRIDYPRRQLEGFLVLEAHDHATIAAAMAAPRPAWLRILIVPPGSPQTKPRALNHALSFATGELVTIYDAEDAPDPAQLREAAARFDQDATLGCLQAPLRVRSGVKNGELSTFLDRQFAFEYASLFEVSLPGMARLGLPFPLGGTSNHMRMSALSGVGGWDAHNVTEDADLGFRLWSAGWKLGMLESPTWETPPGMIDRWLPQRTRWLKGYMQTWGVHTRRPFSLGKRGLLSLVMTLGAAIISAACHAPTLAWLASALMIGIHAGMFPSAPVGSFAVLGLGVIAAWMGCAVGARRAGLDYRLTDILSAPAYWSLLSLAFVHAVWRRIVAPHVWDKTPHDADLDDGPNTECASIIAQDAGREAA